MVRGPLVARDRMGMRGFTLIELLVVVAIIAILAAITLPYTANALDRARASRAEGDVREIQVALERYYADHGQYPNKLSLLSGTYLKENFTFENPYSKSNKKIYYLYAVDDNTTNGTARAYILADPGPKPATGKHFGVSGAIPNGIKPTASAYAYAWSCIRSATTTLTLDNEIECGQENTSLRSYRTDENPRVRTEG